MVQGSTLADIGTGGTCPRVRDGGLRRRGRGMGKWSAQGFNCQERPRLSPDVPPYQRFREGQVGIRQKMILKIFTFEAGMCMKTNKTRTKCPEQIGHSCLSFGHFRLTDTNLAEIRGEFTMKRRNIRGSRPTTKLPTTPKSAGRSWGRPLLTFVYNCLYPHRHAGIIPQHHTATMPMEA